MMSDWSPLYCMISSEIMIVIPALDEPHILLSYATIVLLRLQIQYGNPDKLCSPLEDVYLRNGDVLVSNYLVHPIFSESFELETLLSAIF